MNNLTYNLERHVELLKKEKKLLIEKKDFFKENPAEALELINYDISVEEHIFWENRFQVAWFMQCFLNKKIDVDEFHDIVYALRKDYLDKSEKFREKLIGQEIKYFFPNKKAYKLQGFLSSLFFECEDFEMSSGTEEFYNAIQNKFLKLEKILDED